MPERSLKLPVTNASEQPGSVTDRTLPDVVDYESGVLEVTMHFRDAA